MYFVYGPNSKGDRVVQIFQGHIVDIPKFAEDFPHCIYFEGEIAMNNEITHNIFDGADSTPVVENQIVLVEWVDNSESVFGPYTWEGARNFGEDLAATNDKVQDWTIVPLNKP